MTTLTLESRQLREPLAMNRSHNRANAAFAAYEFSGDVSVDAGVRSESAYHRFLDRSVTIRHLLPTGIGRAQRYYTFVQSIHAQAMLRHPSIAQVFDAGIHDEQPYAVIERPRGTSLDEHINWLAEQGAQADAREVLHTVDALADLVQYAHAHGARVYGLLPSNIVLTEDGTPVLAQIGAPEAPDALRTSEERLAFSAPELLSGALSDQRSEIYALGALLCYMLTGITLRAGDETGTPNEQPLAMSMLPRDVDAEQLERVIRRATARRLSDRYASVAVFRHELALVLAERNSAVDVEEEGPAALFEREFGGAIVMPPQPGQQRQPGVAPSSIVPARAPVETPNELPVQHPSGVPGADRAEYQAALPYTILVPLPDVPPAKPAATAASAPSAASISAGTLSLLSFLLVVAIALGTALMLG
jgi:eukaryotic-like serine/threonine-protein kinase